MAKTLEAAMDRLAMMAQERERNPEKRAMKLSDVDEYLSDKSKREDGENADLDLGTNVAIDRARFILEEIKASLSKGEIPAPDQIQQIFGTQEFQKVMSNGPSLTEIVGRAVVQESLDIAIFKSKSLDDLQSKLEDINNIATRFGGDNLSSDIKVVGQLAASLFKSGIPETTFNAINPKVRAVIQTIAPSIKILKMAA